MKILRRIYGLILSILCMSCSDTVDLGQPVIDPNGVDLGSEYIVVIGDIQEYTYNDRLNPYLEFTMKWIYLAKEAGMDIKCVLQVGDITGKNTEKEWQFFHDNTLAVAKEIPYVACIGNHDYSWDGDSKIIDRDMTYFSDYVSFPNAKAEVVAHFEEDRMENIVVANRIFGRDYYIMVLEFGARHEVVDWADDYLKANPDKRFILLTHEFLSSAGDLVGDDSYALMQLRNTTCCSPEQLWNRLITRNNNIACVLCGHNGFSRLRLAENDFGREVPQILFNLQYQENGGNGMIEIWEIKHDSDSISVGVYSTLDNEYLGTPETSFKFRYRY